MPAPLIRGAVLKSPFPYDEEPDQPGPKSPYCLFVESLDTPAGRLVAVCYGTSQLDGPLMRAHDGLILSVQSQFVRGPMPGPITHWLGDRVATIPESWIEPRFEARLDFMRAEKRKNDQHRQRLFEMFLALESVMEKAALNSFQHALSTGRIGLPPGSSLR